MRSLFHSKQRGLLNSRLHSIPSSIQPKKGRWMLHQAVFLPLSLCLSVAMSACSGNVEDDDTGLPSPTPAETPTAPPATPTPSPTPSPTPTATPQPGTGPAALIVTSNYAEGSLSEVNLDDFSIAADQLELGGDTVVQGHEDRLYLLVRSFGGDNFLSVRDADKRYIELFQVTLPVGSNPHALAFAEGKGYVSLYNGGGVTVFNPESGAVLKHIGLGAYADPDGDPNADGLLVHDGTLYVGLQRVDYTDPSFAPASPGKVVAINPLTDEALYAIDTQGTNLGTLAVNGDGKLLVSSLGAYGAADGGIERLNPVDKVSEGFILTDTDLSSMDLDGFSVVGATGYLLAKGQVLPFALSDGALGVALAGTSSLSLVGLSADARGRLWLADASGLVWVYSPAAGELLTSSGLQVSAKGYAFYDFGFVDP